MGKGATVHKLPILHSEHFRRAGFESISPQSFQHLKARLVVVTEAVQGREISPDDYLALDEVTHTGKGYLDLIKRFYGFGDDPNDAANASYLGALASVAKSAVTYAAGYIDESEQIVQQQLRRASRMRDADVLNMVRLQWMQLMPKSSTELMSLAGRNILEKLEMTCNTTAHRMSEEQFRASETIFRGKVESTFRGMLDSRLQRMKEEINKAEVTNYPGYVYFILSCRCRMS